MYGMDLAFLTAWTEVPEWFTFTKKNDIKTYLNISEFLKSYK